MPMDSTAAAASSRVTTPTTSSPSRTETAGAVSRAATFAPPEVAPIVERLTGGLRSGGGLDLIAIPALVAYNYFQRLIRAKLAAGDALLAVGDGAFGGRQGQR